MKQLIIFNEIGEAAAYGIGTFIREMVERLHNKFKIYIVVFYTKDKEFIVKEEINHKELHIPSPQRTNTVEGETDKRYFINSIYLISDYIKKDDEVIFHFNYFRYESFVDLLREFFPEAKMVFTIHYMYGLFLIDGNIEYFKEIISKPIQELTKLTEREVFRNFQSEKAFLNKMDHVFCLAEYARNVLLNDYQIPDAKIILLFNGLKDDGIILSCEEKEKEKESIQLPIDSKIILFVGRLDKLKGLEYVIRAFKKICQKRDDCFLIIIGDGEYDTYLKESEGCRHNIIFTGRIDKEKVYRYYRIADVGVLLSKHEQCSYVAIEMMMHSLPIIASDSVGLNEMVFDGVNGYKINSIRDKENVSFDIDLCYERLSQVLNENNESLRLKSRARYEQQYRIEKMTQRLLSVFETI